MDDGKQAALFADMTAYLLRANVPRMGVFKFSQVDLNLRLHLASIIASRERYACSREEKIICYLMNSAPAFMQHIAFLYHPAAIFVLLERITC